MSISTLIMPIVGYPVALQTVGILPFVAHISCTTNLTLPELKRDGHLISVLLYCFFQPCLHKHVSDTHEHEPGPVLLNFE